MAKPCVCAHRLPSVYKPITCLQARANILTPINVTLLIALPQKLLNSSFSSVEEALG